jgi:hypothetical protein
VVVTTTTFFCTDRHNHDKQAPARMRRLPGLW